MGSTVILVGATVLLIQFAVELLSKPEKTSAEEALGKAIGKYLESGIKVKVDQDSK